MTYNLFAKEIKMKHIFDKVSRNINMGSSADRLIKMSEEEEIIKYKKSYYSYGYATLFDFVDNFCFNTWKHRNECVDVSDFLNVLDYEEIKQNAHTKSESLLELVELIYNFWLLAFTATYEHSNSVTGVANFHHLKKVMDDLVEKHNYVVELLDDNTMVRIVPNKPEVNAVAEKLPDDAGIDTVMYNHSSLKGNLSEKRRILIELGKKLEPQRDKLKNENRDLEDDIFCMLNNLDIRHNNTSEVDEKQFKPVVANMSEEEIEEWYDDLYEMILIAFLLVRNIDRKKKVKELRDRMKQ